MLAMYIVLQNPLGMVCDYPAAYEGQPGFEFIKRVPTNWDETKVIDAKISEYVVVARKKDNDWFVGSINNHSVRTITVSLSFLEDGEYTAEIFSDAEDVNSDPNHLKKENKAVNKNDILNIRLAGGGGIVIHLKKN
jgi:alpha-glucosidase